jgi:hypothetical protein
MASLLVPGLLSVRPAEPPGAGVRTAANGPRIGLRTNHDDDSFERGDEMSVFLRTDAHAYVLVVRIDTDGHARVLYPPQPSTDNFARAGVDLLVPGTREGYTLRVNEYPGQGFLFALVTLDPITFDVLARGDEWDYTALGLHERVTVDPYLVFSDLLAALIPEDYLAYDHVVLPYYVGGGHGYPRFVCYQCHAYVSPAAWDPYAHSCIRVDVTEPAWWRYPYGHYAGTEVVLPPRAVRDGYTVDPRDLEAAGGRSGRVRPASPAARSPAAVGTRRRLPPPRRTAVAGGGRTDAAQPAKREPSRVRADPSSSAEKRPARTTRRRPQRAGAGDRGSSGSRERMR